MGMFIPATEQSFKVVRDALVVYEMASGAKPKPQQVQRHTFFFADPRPSMAQRYRVSNQ